MAATGETRLAIIGGGAAGLAAAVAAVERGLQPTLFEASPRLGGRAASYLEPRTGQQVDLCQHVAMGCCTHFLDLCRKTDTERFLARHRRLHFFGPDGRRRDFAATRWLPAPLHLLPAFWGLDYLTRSERLGIMRAMARLARLAPDGAAAEKTLGTWLREEGQTGQAVERFWSVVVESSLSVKVEDASLMAARKVFVEGFLASRDAYELIVPTVSLGELWAAVGRWLESRGAVIRLRSAVRGMEDSPAGKTLLLADGTRETFDCVIAAVHWRQIRGLLAAPLLEKLPQLTATQQIESAPITAVHLWYDRPIADVPHAALVGRMGQWVFCPQREQQIDSRPAYYAQVVISASHALVGRAPETIAAEVCDELAAIFPAAQGARLLHQRVVTHRHAVFAMRPGIDSLRPSQQTTIRNLCLAGDWTATDWPATMEGAIRSGYLAVEAISTQ